MAIRCPHCRLLIGADPRPGTSLPCPRCGWEVSATDGEPTAQPAGGGPTAAPEQRRGSTVSGDPTRTPTTSTPSGPDAGDEGSAPPRIPGYEFDEKPIGRGGMGSVWLARQLSLGRKVAVKVLSQALADDPEFLRRFEREAAVMARFSHPNIVQIFDRGEAAGKPYFIMEYVEGPGGGPPFTLRDRIAAGEIPVAEVQNIVVQTAQALEAAHREGIVHRDIKPANILIDRDGRVKVSDFGIAHVAGHGESGAHPDLTREGVVMGTLRYMAPEQETDSRAVDHRADIYSLGRVLYHMLTGICPLGTPPAPTECVEGLDPAWDRIVARATAYAPARRYPDMAAFRREVEGASRGAAETPEPPAPTTDIAQVNALVREAEDAIARRELDRAEGAIHRALALVPNHARARHLCHEIAALRRRGEIDALVAEAERAYARFAFADCSRAAGQVVAMEPDHAVAAKLVARAQKAETFASTLLGRAREHIERGDGAGAERNLQKLLEKLPGHPEAAALRKRARDECPRALQAIAQARALLAKGDAGGAARAIAEAATLAPQHPDVEPLGREIRAESERRNRRIAGAVAGAAILIVLAIVIVNAVGKRAKGAAERRRFEEVHGRVQQAAGEDEIRSAKESIRAFLSDYPRTEHAGALRDDDADLDRRLTGIREEDVLGDIEDLMHRDPAAARGRWDAISRDPANRDIRPALEKRILAMFQKDEDARYRRIQGLRGEHRWSEIRAPIAECLAAHPAGAHATELRALASQIDALEEDDRWQAFRRQMDQAEGDAEKQLEILDREAPSFRLPENVAKIDALRTSIVETLGGEAQKALAERIDELRRQEDWAGAIRELDAFLADPANQRFRAWAQALRGKVIAEEGAAAFEAALADARQHFAAGRRSEALLALRRYAQTHEDGGRSHEVAQEIVRYADDIRTEPGQEREAARWLEDAWAIDLCEAGIQSRLIELGRVWKGGRWIDQEEYAKTAGFRKDAAGTWRRSQPCPTCSNAKNLDGETKPGKVPCSRDGRHEITDNKTKRVYRNVRCKDLARSDIQRLSGGYKCPGSCNNTGWVDCKECVKGEVLVPVDWSAECDDCTRP
ncbi:MAG: protein kinase [Planctomycetes bacterium]|nr:protein kinase [Planctomycetota bacterium]